MSSASWLLLLSVPLSYDLFSMWPKSNELDSNWRTAAFAIPLTKWSQVSFRSFGSGDRVQSPEQRACWEQAVETENPGCWAESMLGAGSQHKGKCGELCGPAGGRQASCTLLWVFPSQCLWARRRILFHSPATLRVYCAVSLAPQHTGGTVSTPGWKSEQLSRRADAFIHLKRDKWWSRKDENGSKFTKHEVAGGINSHVSVLT